MYTGANALAGITPLCRYISMSSMLREPPKECPVNTIFANGLDPRCSCTIGRNLS